MEEEELQIQRALYIANNKKAALMMLGSIDYYYDSVSIDTKVIVSTMIISVESGKKLWWGTTPVRGKAGRNPSFSGII